MSAEDSELLHAEQAEYEAELTRNMEWFTGCCDKHDMVDLFEPSGALGRVWVGNVRAEYVTSIKNLHNASLSGKVRVITTPSGAAMMLEHDGYGAENVEYLLTCVSEHESQHATITALRNALAPLLHLYHGQIANTGEYYPQLFDAARSALSVPA